jgi:ABC-type amino acid transport substrate-binding protein
MDQQQRTTTRPRASLLSRWAAVTGIVLVAGAALSACSSPASGSADTLLERVQGNELRMAVFSGPPQSYQAPDGTWTGYDIDILTGFAETLNAKPEFVALPFDATLEAVQSQRADVTMGIYWNEKRARAMDFSRPMGNFVDGVAVRASDPLVTDASFAGLDGKNVGAIAGTIYVDQAEQIPGANVVKFSGEPDLLSALKQGRIDAALNSSVAISTWAANASNDVELLGPVPLADPVPLELLRGYFAVQKGEYSATFLAKLNEYLQTISCDGTLEEIMAKYDVTDPIFFEGLCEASDVPGLAGS